MGEKASNDINARKIVEITSVQKQVVAGIKYTVQLNLAVTECLKGVNAEELSNCKESSGHEHQQCTIQIWEQPWRDFLEVQKLECKSVSSEEQEANDSENLPLLGQNLINRGKREAHTAGMNGPLLGMFLSSKYKYSFKHKKGY